MGRSTGVIQWGLPDRLIRPAAGDTPSDTGRRSRRQWCRPRQSPAGCARRRPIEMPEDAGSIPATSKSAQAAA